MSVIAAALKHMLAAGMEHDSIVAAVADMEAAIPGDVQAERRRAADRERKRLRNSAESAESAESDDKVSPLCPPNKDAPTPPEINPPYIPPSSSVSKGASASEFSEFWSIYPNRVGKRDAEKAFSKALKRADLETIISGLRRYVAKTDDRPWCNPATWLNQDRWEDAPAEVAQRATAPPFGTKKTTQASIWTEEAIAHGIIDEPVSTENRRLGTGFARGQDQSPGFARRIASA